MAEPFLLAKSSIPLHFLPRMANRHGLIAGATGTGKTITLQTLAENFSALGVPVFLADVKGDLSGLAKAGGPNPKVQERVRVLGLDDFVPTAFPVTFWDVFGVSGHPVRATISEMGPLLLGRLLNLNDTQEGVLHLVFKVADDAGLLLLDLKDLRADAAVRRGKCAAVYDSLRQRLRRQHRRHPAKSAHTRAAGRRKVLRRAHRESRRLHADRRRWAWRDQCARRGSATGQSARLRRHAALAAQRAFRKSARSRRPR